MKGNCKNQGDKKDHFDIKVLFKYNFEGLIKCS